MKPARETGCAIFFDDCFQQLLPMRLHSGVHPPQQGDCVSALLVRAKAGKARLAAATAVRCVSLVSEPHPTTDSPCAVAGFVKVEQLGPMRCGEAAVDIDLVDEAHGTLSENSG